MSKAKAKGTRGENVIVEKHISIGIPAERVPLSGSIGGKYSGDVVIPDISSPIFRCEVKSRKSTNGFSVIARWLGDNDMLFIREDRQPPLVVMPWKTYEKMMVVFYEKSTKSAS